MKRLVAIAVFLFLVSGASGQTTAASADANKLEGKTKLVFYYGKPVPLKHCLEQMAIQIDGATVHNIFQWHVWQTEVAPGSHILSDDSHRDKGLTVTLAAGQTYYYQIEWHKGFGFPKCENFWNRVDDMKPKDVQRVSAMLGKPGTDETATSAPATAVPEAVKSTGQKLLVESTPERADIEVDGSFVGNTPSTLELTPGEHTVVVSKSGYKPWQRKVKLSGGEVKLSAELEKDTP